MAPADWVVDLPDSLMPGSQLREALAVRPALFDPTARVTGAVADLSRLGGPDSGRLEPAPDGTRIAFTGTFLPDIYVVELATGGITQLTRTGRCYGPLWLPAGAVNPVQVLDDGVDGVIYQGRNGRRLRADRIWVTTYEATRQNLAGYTALRFDFHPGDARLTEAGWLKLRVSDTQIDLLDRIDPGLRAWQEVSIGLADLAVDGPVTRIELSGTLLGTFYMAHLRLTSTDTRPETAVTAPDPATPGAFALTQNYPNPFNSDTVVEFQLPSASEVAPEVYNLTGQRVATLTQGWREAGSHQVRWDGRDEAGQAPASGVYFSRIIAGSRTQSRKLLLLR